MSKFKIGDKVRLLVEDYVDIEKGSLLTVVKDGTLGDCWISDKEVEISMLDAYRHEFELVEEPENTLKFVPGDRVKVKSTAGFSRHATGVVTAREQNPNAAWFVEGFPEGVVWVLRDGASGACYFHPEELELVEAAQTSNQTPSLVHKTTPKNDDSSEERAYCVSGNNTWFERGELPPIGSKVEFQGYQAGRLEWKQAFVVGHDGQIVVLNYQGNYLGVHVDKLRPIKTAEEIEAEARKKAVGAVEEQILEQMGELNVRNLAEHIVDTFDLRFTKEE